ncbi:MAG: hypothetical protein HY082_11800, partial [Gammaproteobacteria bacterium]|nr:hypothetical protein [Gammaproteobacteria bacterium]
ASHLPWLAAIEQVNRAIMQMDGVTQSNAAQVEELSGTSQSLASQAEHLKELVSHFTFRPEAMKRFAGGAGVGEKMKTAASDSKPAKAQNVQYLKPRVVAQKASAAGGRLDRVLKRSVH